MEQPVLGEDTAHAMSSLPTVSDDGAPWRMVTWLLPPGGLTVRHLFVLGGVSAVVQGGMIYFATTMIRQFMGE